MDYDSEKFYEGEKKMFQAIESDTKGIVVKYTPGTATCWRIQDFLHAKKCNGWEGSWTALEYPAKYNDMAYKVFQDLKANADKKIVIHDSTVLLYDEAVVNMLKACAEPEGDVCWARVGQRDHFRFTGQLIFVENDQRAETLAPLFTIIDHRLVK